MHKVALFLATLVASASAAAADNAAFSKRLAAGARDQIYISNVAGSVTITAWDRPEVDVQGRLGSDVLRVDMERTNSGVDIRVVVRESILGHRDVGARLDIRVPAGSELEVSAVSSSIVVSGVRGRSRLKSVSGSIRSDNQGAQIEAKTVSGRVDVMGSGVRGRTRVSTISGAVNVERVAGDIEAETTSGQLRVAADQGGHVDLHTVSGAITFRGRLATDGELEVEAVSGSVNITASADAGYTYKASTFSGAIHNCFGAEGDNRRGSGREISGTLGAGSAQVRLKAMSGSVTVCDR